MEYLLGWSSELLGRSGMAQSGFAPLSYPVIESWARLTGRTVTPEEVSALIVLDSVRLHPGSEKDDVTDDEE